ncbi:hypothetical protein BD413DRAFT_587334 [Trametes elegans]|nr:hypothetical protein BD413DRAFT_587334 [Trametes elegans]
MSATPTLAHTSVYAGLLVSCILYGGELVLFASTVRLALEACRERTRVGLFSVIFSASLLCLNTIFLATIAFFGGQMWVVREDDLGGATWSLDATLSVWYLTWGVAAGWAADMLSQALLIYLCWVIWDDSRVLVALVVFCVGTYSVGIALLSTPASPHHFLELSGRLAVAGTPASRRYTSAAAVIVESGLLYTVAGVGAVVAFAAGSAVKPFFVMLCGMMICISPQLIIYRVLAGRAWTRDRSRLLTSCSVNLEFIGGAVTAAADTQSSGTVSET